MPFPLAEKMGVMMALIQLYLISTVGLKRHLFPGTEWDHNPRDVPGAKMLNPDLFWCYL